MFLQQFSHQTQRCPGVALRLHQEIQNLAFLVDGAPSPMASSSDNKDHFIKMPIVTGPGSMTAQILCDRDAEFDEPAPHRLIGNI